MDLTDTITRYLIGGGYALVPMTVFLARRHIQRTMWPAALFATAVATAWAGWYLILAVTRTEVEEMTNGFNRALHLPIIMFILFLILVVFRSPSKVAKDEI